MSRAAVLAAALLVPAGPPASFDFGSVELGGAATHTLASTALGATVSGVGFSATRTARGVLIVYEPYELNEEARGTLTLKLPSGLVRVALHGRGVDTIPPTVTVDTPSAARAGRPLTIRFEASDNDLVTTCMLEIGGRVIARLPWPATAYRWTVPAHMSPRARITVIAVDRAGNRASATSRAFTIRQ
jgi:hypothetical protein